MEAIAVPLMLILAGISFFTAVIGLIGGVMEFLLQNEKARYWWRISGGICFIAQAAAGAVAVGYIHEGRLMTTICVLVFLVIGVLLLNYGLNLRQRFFSGKG